MKLAYLLVICLISTTFTGCVDDVDDAVSLAGCPDSDALNYTPGSTQLVDDPSVICIMESELEESATEFISFLEDGPYGSEFTLISETFDEANITGANTTVLYGGGGSDHNSKYERSGTFFGWFNVKNDIGNVDIYERSIPNLFLGCKVTASAWMRQSFTSTDISVSLRDADGKTEAYEYIQLTNTYQEVILESIVNSNEMSYVIHYHSIGGADGLDVIIEDLLITQACQGMDSTEIEGYTMAVSEVQEDDSVWEYTETMLMGPDGFKVHIEDNYGEEKRNTDFTVEGTQVQIMTSDGENSMNIRMNNTASHIDLLPHFLRDISIDIEDEEEEMSSIDAPPFIVSSWDDGAPEGYSLASHIMFYEETTGSDGECFECDCRQNSGGYWGEYYDCINRSRDECGTYCVLCDADANFVGHTCPEPEPPQPNGQCYELAKHSLNTWSIVNLADGWIIDGPGYGYSVYEWGLGAENRPHDTLYKLNALNCNTSDLGIDQESEDEDLPAEEPCGYRGMNCLLKTGTGPYPEGVSIGYDMIAFEGLYYGGLVEDKDCHNLLDNGYQCELYYKIDENGDRIAPQQFPEIVDKSFFVGTYEKQPITNNWHEVTIYINEADQLTWQNGATEWSIHWEPIQTPSEEEYSRCGFQGQDCNLLEGGESPYGYGNIASFNEDSYEGLFLRNELYALVDESSNRISRGSVPNSVDLTYFVGNYERQPVENFYHTVTVYVNEDGQLMWQIGTGTEWQMHWDPIADDIAVVDAIDTNGISDENPKVEDYTNLFLPNEATFDDATLSGSGWEFYGEINVDGIAMGQIIITADLEFKITGLRLFDKEDDRNSVSIERLYFPNGETVVDQSLELQPLPFVLEPTGWNEKMEVGVEENVTFGQVISCENLILESALSGGPMEIIDAILGMDQAPESDGCFEVPNYEIELDSNASTENPFIGEVLWRGMDDGKEPYDPTELMESLVFNEDNIVTTIYNYQAIGNSLDCNDEGGEYTVQDSSNDFLSSICTITNNYTSFLIDSTHFTLELEETDGSMSTETVLYYKDSNSYIFGEVIDAYFCDEDTWIDAKEYEEGYNCAVLKGLHKLPTIQEMYSQIEIQNLFGELGINGNLNDYSIVFLDCHYDHGCDNATHEISVVDAMSSDLIMFRDLDKSDSISDGDMILLNGTMLGDGAVLAGDWNTVLLRSSEADEFTGENQLSGILSKTRQTDRVDATKS